MDINQTQPIPPPPSTLPPVQPTPRRTPWVLIIGIIVVACLALGTGGGLIAYTTFTTYATATGVALGNTATAQDQATGTQVARVTGTANAHSTATGVAVATRTARAEATAARAVELTATAETLLSAAPVPFSWKLVRYDTFDSNALNWYLFTDDNEFGTFEYGIDNGVMFADATAKRLFYVWTRPRQINAVEDFYASVEVSLAKEDTTTEYGLMFHHNEGDDTFYWIAVRNSGNYFLLRNNKQTWTILHTGYSREVNRAGENTIAVRMVKDEITVYANGAEVTNLKDGRLTSGAVSLFMQINRYNQPIHLEYDNFYVLSP